MSKVLSDNQEQIVLGTTFGDGHLQVYSGNGNARFSTSCRDKDKDYLFWKYSELSGLGLFSQPPKPRVRSRWGFPTVTWSLRSRLLPVFSGYYKTFYLGRKKIATPEALDQLNELGLSVWWQDDGSVIRVKGGRRLSHVVFCTEGFSHRENSLIADWLVQKYNVPFRIRPHRQNGHVNWQLVLCGVDQIERFLGIVDPFILPCMARKSSNWRNN